MSLSIYMEGSPFIPQGGTLLTCVYSWSLAEEAVSLSSSVGAVHIACQEWGSGCHQVPWLLGRCTFRRVLVSREGLRLWSGAPGHRFPRISLVMAALLSSFSSRRLYSHWKDAL